MADESLLSMFPGTGPDVAPDDAMSPAAAAPELEVAPPDPFLSRDFLANEFVLWLWFKTEHDFGSFNLPDGPIDLWFDDKLTFLAQEEKKVVSAFNGGAPSTTPEAKLSILSGKMITEARLGMRRGDSEWSFILRIRGGDLQLHGLKIPAVVKEGAEEMIYERMFLIDTVNRSLSALFEIFFRDRSGETWQTAVMPAMSRWLLGEE
jgi:hypothetical protein